MGHPSLKAIQQQARAGGFASGRVDAVDTGNLTTDVLVNGQVVAGAPGFVGTAAAGQEVLLAPVAGGYQVAGSGGYWTPRTSD